MRHAIPNVVEGKIVPVALFLVLLRLGGTNPALLGALAWSLAALGRRLLLGQRASGLLVLTTIGLVTRTAVGLVTGSLVVYFLQPTAATALVGLAFLGSVLIGRPLAERLFLDIYPIDDATRSHPTLRRFFAHVSLWWAFTSMVNFAITLWLLLEGSAATFVLVKAFLGPVTTAFTLSVAYLWFKSLAERTGTTLVFAEVR